jgi:hypothetical protein
MDTEFVAEFCRSQHLFHIKLQDYSLFKYVIHLLAPTCAQMLG